LPRHTPLLVIGAGPFGLAVARYAKAHGMDHLVVGRPMGFWKDNIPAGMLLRSGVDWHLDPLGELTFESYAHDQDIDLADLNPLGVDPYLAYVEWFQQRAGVEIENDTVASLEFSDAPERPGSRFVAKLRSGTVVNADRVVLAVGFHSFAHVPSELADRVPAERRVHTRDFVDFSDVGGQRFAIVGGRQSAFEWAALLKEGGAETVHLVYRHDTPAFSASDWSWVGGMLDQSEKQPGWWRQLPEAERTRIGQRFWAEGRLKLEPWLAPRIEVPGIELWPHTHVAGARTDPAGDLELELTDATGTATGTIAVDRVILATGYQVDMDRVRVLGPELRRHLRTTEGSPVLEPGFRSSVPGLYIASMPAVRDFGPFLAFTVSVPAAARMIGQALRAND